MITGAQIRMARGYLKWSVQELAKRSSLGISTIQRAEAVDGVPTTWGEKLAVLQQTLEEAGIEFIPKNGGGPGVRLKE